MNIQKIYETHTINPDYTNNGKYISIYDFSILHKIDCRKLYIAECFSFPRNHTRYFPVCRTNEIIEKVNKTYSDN